MDIRNPDQTILSNFRTEINNYCVGLPWRHFFRGCPREVRVVIREKNSIRRDGHNRARSCPFSRVAHRAPARRPPCATPAACASLTSATQQTRWRRRRCARRGGAVGTRGLSAAWKTAGQGLRLPSCLLYPRLCRRRCFRREPVAHLQLVHAHSAQQCLRRYARARNHLELAPELAVKRTLKSSRAGGPAERGAAWQPLTWHRYSDGFRC